MCRHGACEYTWFNGDTLFCIWDNGKCREWSEKDAEIKSRVVLNSNATAAGNTLDLNEHTKAASNERYSVTDNTRDTGVALESSSRGHRPGQMIVCSDSSDAGSNHECNDQDAQGGYKADSEANACAAGRVDDSLCQLVYR